MFVLSVQEGPKVFSGKFAVIFGINRPQLHRKYISSDMFFKMHAYKVSTSTRMIFSLMFAPVSPETADFVSKTSYQEETLVEEVDGRVEMVEMGLENMKNPGV